MTPAPAHTLSSRMRGVRIIGGKWRNTRLCPPPIAGVRPTPDRVRETLFNWLAPTLAGARVLDLFAGSGALTIEAVSRGAQCGLLVERHHRLCAHLRERVGHLRAEAQLRVIHADALAWLAHPPSQRFDLVFCDPPFGLSLWRAVYAALLPHLAPAAWIYSESPITHPAAPPPKSHVHRQSSTAQVHFALYRYTADKLEPL